MKNGIVYQSEQDGFMLGNIDQSLYCPFKGFSNYPIIPKTARGQRLYEVMMYDFYAHELNLYLDTHPCDSEAMQRFVKYQQKAQCAKEQYEQQFGVLEVSDISTCQKFHWICGPWPWQRQ